MDVLRLSGGGLHGIGVPVCMNRLVGEPRDRYESKSFGDSVGHSVLRDFAQRYVSQHPNYIGWSCSGFIRTLEEKVNWAARSALWA